MRLALLTACLLPFLASAFTFTNQYLIPANQTISDEQWVVSTVAQPEGIFLNDLSIICANPLQLNGTYAGNINGIAGMETVLSGIAKRNARITGKVIRIEGIVEGNLLLLADTVTINQEAVIGGNVRILADKVISEGTIGGDLHVTAGSLLNLDGTIAGTTYLQAREILTEETLRIGGDFTYRSDNLLLLDPAQVEGSIQLIESNPTQAPLSPARLKSRGLWLFAAFLAGAAYLLLFPSQAAHATHFVFTAPLKSSLIGFLASGALPILGVFCLTSFVGLPTGLLMLGLWGAWVYLSQIVTACLIGLLLLRLTGAPTGRLLLASAIGLLLLALIGLIPALELPVQAISLWLGMGAILQAIFLNRSESVATAQRLNTAQLQTMDTN